MTQSRPGNCLIALLISSLAFANPMLAVKRTNAKRTTVTITVDGDATVDTAANPTDPAACDAPCDPAKAKLKDGAQPACDPAACATCPADAATKSGMPKRNCDAASCASAADATCADSCAKAKQKLTPATDNAACTDSCPIVANTDTNCDTTRVLAPAIAGGVIVTPAFEYSIKSSDLSTPLGTGNGQAATPGTSSVMFTITTPGRYYLAGDTAARNSGSFSNTTMFYVNANNVIFDLNGKTIFPNGTGSGTNGAGLTAIRVAQNLSNVVIKNGQINGYQPNGTTAYITTGIIVGAGCSNLTITDLAISNIGGSNAPNPYGALGAVSAAAAGLQINDYSATAYTLCSNLLINNVSVSNTNTSATTSTPAAGLVMYYANNIQISSCSFSSSSNSAASPSATSYGVYLNSCNTVNFTGCTAAQNGLFNGVVTSGPAIGFADVGSSSISFTNCAATQTTGTAVQGFALPASGTAVGPYSLTGCSASNALGTSTTYGFNIGALATLTNCSGNNNTTSGGTCYGIYLTAANGSQLIGCQSNGNTGTSGVAAGIYINNSDGVVLNTCTSNSNINNTAGSVAGFYLAGSDSAQLLNCATGENRSSTSGVPVYGFYTNGTSSLFNNCSASHNQNTSSTGSTSTIVAGFYLTGATGNQFVNCQARNNLSSSTGACSVAGFYSTSGTANQFSNCQAVNNTASSSTTSTGAAAGIFLTGETRSQILACNCSSNSTSTSSSSSIGYGIYLTGGTVNTMVRDCQLNFNTGGYMYGFYDSLADTTSVLINNQAAGQGRCIALLSTSFHFPANTSMNFFFSSEGTNENPRNIIVETDNFSWQVLSTAVPQWSNISIVIGQVS